MSKYLKIYFWQAISIAFNFAAVFVVTPYISSIPSLYGIYTVVTAAYLFVSYADFGFLSAGMKYAAESYARNNLIEEIEVIGFSGMIFLTFIIVYAAIILGISFNPGILVGGITDPGEIETARELLIILGLFSPVFVLQRIIQIIYGIRLHDYVFQRLLIVSNLIKVTSVFIFLGGGKYLIVEYFLFSQICTLSAVIGGLYLMKRRLNYDIGLLFRSFRFSNRLFQKTRKLAFTSIFLTLCWILYYELDPFVIGKFLGAKSVAIYAIGLTIIAYFRSLFGLFFTPFIARFNHFIGLKDKKGLQEVLIKVLTVFFPITVFPVIAVFLTARNFVFNWVGPEYSTSVPIAQLLVLSYIYSFISYPAGILIMANEKIKALYITSALQPIVYWSGIIFTFSYLGLESFAYFKFMAFSLEALIYLIIVLRFLNMNILGFFRKMLYPTLMPLGIIILSLLYVRQYMSLEHSKLNLAIYFLINGLIISVAVGCYYYTSKLFRQYINQLMGGLMEKIKPREI